MARFARQLNFINIFQAKQSLNSIMILHISFLYSFQILKLSNHAYVNDVYPSYCDTAVALYMQAYELIRSVKNCRILYWFKQKLFWGPFSIQLRQFKYC